MISAVFCSAVAWPVWLLEVAVGMRISSALPSVAVTTVHAFVFLSCVFIFHIFSPLSCPLLPPSLICLWHLRLLIFPGPKISAPQPAVVLPERLALSEGRHSAHLRYEVCDVRACGTITLGVQNLGSFSFSCSPSVLGHGCCSLNERSLCINITSSWEAEGGETHLPNSELIGICKTHKLRE